MKAFLTAIAAVALTGCAVNAQPVAKRTPNGGVEHYSNQHGVKGSAEHGCVLPWQAAGFPTVGHSPKRVEFGDPTQFYDCGIEQKAVVVTPAPQPVAPAVVAPRELPPQRSTAPQKAPEAPVAAPVPAPKEEPKRVTKPLRE